MSKAVYIQIFIGDWIRDTRCLSLAARGVYTELKMHLEREKEKGVMDCVITELAGLLGFSYSSVSPLLDEIFAKQVLTCEKLGGGKVRIIDEEMRAQALKKAAKSRAGKKGMANRYGSKKCNSVITDDITSVITHNDNGINSDNESEDREGGAGGNNLNASYGEIKMPFDGDDFKEKWDEWKQHLQQQHNWRYGYQQERHVLENLWRLADGKKEVAIELISNSITVGAKNIGKYSNGSATGNTNGTRQTAGNANTVHKGGATLNDLEQLKRGRKEAGDERTEFTTVEVVE